MLGALDRFQLLCFSSLLAFAFLLIFNIIKGNIKELLTGNTEKVSNLAYITPFASLVWVAIFLKEKIEIHSIIGLVMIVLGIFVQMKRSSSQRLELLFYVVIIISGL